MDESEFNFIMTYLHAMFSVALFSYNSSMMISDYGYPDCLICSSEQLELTQIRMNTKWGVYIYDN